MVRFLAGGVVLAAIAGAWLYFGASKEGRSGSSPGEQGPAASSSSGQSPSGPSGVGGATPPTPRRMTAKDPPSDTVLPVATSISLSDAFAHEAPNAMASERTNMIRGVVGDLVADNVGVGDISGLECRTRHCLLQITGDDPKGVVALVDALQDERGFLGKAESLMMSRDGETIHIYLRFPEEP